jgi:hypothetical protein
MSICINCPACERTLAVKAGPAGRRVQCPCGAIVAVPGWAGLLLPRALRDVPEFVWWVSGLGLLAVVLFIGVQWEQQRREQADRKQDDERQRRNEHLAALRARFKDVTYRHPDDLARREPGPLTPKLLVLAENLKGGVSAGDLLSPRHLDVPDDLRAEGPQEVGTVVWLSESFEGSVFTIQDGIQGESRDSYKTIRCTLLFVDRAGGQVVDQAVFTCRERDVGPSVTKALVSRAGGRREQR